jgi:CHASE2 domain-containing sensor protein
VDGAGTLDVVGGESVLVGAAADEEALAEVLGEPPPLLTSLQKLSKPSMAEPVVKSQPSAPPGQDIWYAP